MRFNPDPALKAAITRLPRQLTTLASPNRNAAIARRTLVLDPMMGMGPGMMGMMGMGEMRGPQSNASAATATPVTTMPPLPR